MASSKSHSVIGPANALRRDLLQAALSVTSLLTVSGAGLLAGCNRSGSVSSGNARATGPESSDELIELSAREAVRHIREGSITAESYVTRLLEQYEKCKHLNTVISISETRVLESARAVDEARSRGDGVAPIAGLPLMVKDQIEAKGYPTTAGTAALKDYISSKNAPVLETLLQSGAILFAKANLQELAQGPTSSNPTFGFVRNPYDPTRIPGGSSGGNAAALAARIVPAGLGEDTGGSIRIPAAFCGIAGLRPSTGGTRKRYPDGGLVPPAKPDDLQTIGPMARTVADVAFLDSLITGEEAKSVETLSNVRLAIPNPGYWDREDVDESVAQCMKDVFQRLREAGASLVEMDFDAFIELGDRVAPALRSGDRDADFVAWLEQNLPGVTLADVVEGITSKDVKASRESRMDAAPEPVLSPRARAELRAKVAREYEAMFRGTGAAALAFPCVPVPAPAIKPGGDEPGDRIPVNGKLLSRNAVVIRNTWWGARMGAPGLVVPAGLASGLPVGMELEALPNHDSRLLGLGIAIENVLGPLPPPRVAGEEYAES